MPTGLSDGGLLSWDAWDLREGKTFLLCLQVYTPRGPKSPICYAKAVLFPPFWCTWTFSHFINSLWRSSIFL